MSEYPVFKVAKNRESMILIRCRGTEEEKRYYDSEHLAGGILQTLLTTGKQTYTIEGNTTLFLILKDIWEAG